MWNISVQTLKLAHRFHTERLDPSVGLRQYRFYRFGYSPSASWGLKADVDGCERLIRTVLLYQYNLSSFPPPFGRSAAEPPTCSLIEGRVWLLMRRILYLLWSSEFNILSSSSYRRFIAVLSPFYLRFTWRWRSKKTCFQLLISSSNLWWHRLKWGWEQQLWDLRLKHNKTKKHKYKSNGC